MCVDNPYDILTLNQTFYFKEEFKPSIKDYSNEDKLVQAYYNQKKKRYLVDLRDIHDDKHIHIKDRDDRFLINSLKYDLNNQKFKTY